MSDKEFFSMLLKQSSKEAHQMYMNLPQEYILREEVQGHEKYCIVKLPDNKFWEYVTFSRSCQNDDWETYKIGGHIDQNLDEHGNRPFHAMFFLPYDGETDALNLGDFPTLEEAIDKMWESREIYKTKWQEYAESV